MDAGYCNTGGKRDERGDAAFGSVRLAVAGTLRSRLLGLAGKEGYGGVLALVPCRDVHTYTMRDNIDVAFVSDEGIVLESHRNVPPRSRLRNARADAVLERFSSKSEWYSPGDVVQLKVDPPVFCKVEIAL